MFVRTHPCRSSLLSPFFLFAIGAVCAFEGVSGCASAIKTASTPDAALHARVGISFSSPATPPPLNAQALRIYAVIDQVSRAEELYRSIVVDPFMAEHITADRLHSAGLESLLQEVRGFVEGPCALVVDISAKPGACT